MAAAIRRVKPMANALLRDAERKLPEVACLTWKSELALCRQVINQERRDKNKIYSFHEPEACCIAKGKEHKKYEFGAKAAIAMTKTSCIIVGVKSFSRNEYDGDTLKAILPHVEKIMGKAPRRALCDRGFRGRKRVGDTTIILPESPSLNASESPNAKRAKTLDAAVPLNRSSDT